MADQMAFNIEEAANQLRISPWQAYELVKKGKLGAIKIGRRVIVPRQALENYLSQWQNPTAV